MIRKLFIVAGSGLVLSVVCLTAGVALANRDLARHNWNWTMVKTGDHLRFVKGATPQAVANVSKTLPWTGESLALDGDANVEYVQGDEASVTITGPQSDVDRVHVENGRVFLMGPSDDTHEVVNFHFGPDGIDAQSSHKSLKIVVTAPSVKRFELSGDGNLDIRSYDQPALDMIVTGSGSADVSGRTDMLKVNMSGSGSADMAELRAKDADVSVSGSGSTTVAAAAKVNVDISGSGSVELTTKPESVTSHISGSGSLDQD